jgi:hypothetical protein
MSFIGGPLDGQKLPKIDHPMSGNPLAFAVAMNQHGKVACSYKLAADQEQSLRYEADPDLVVALNDPENPVMQLHVHEVEE